MLCCTAAAAAADAVAQTAAPTAPPPATAACKSLLGYFEAVGHQLPRTCAVQQQGYLKQTLLVLPVLETCSIGTANQAPNKQCQLSSCLQVVVCEMPAGLSGWAGLDNVMLSSAVLLVM